MSEIATFNVDLTNPGQFLACCGLLELANSLDQGAMGWFDSDRFCLRGAEAGELVAHFKRCAVRVVAGPGLTAREGDAKEESAEKSPPLELDAPFRLRLDWWLDRSAVRSGFKTWGGGQTVAGFFDGMRKRIERDDSAADMLTRATPIESPAPFSFDSRLSVLTLIDLGFFPEKTPPTFSPAVEALTLVGLQRFRPATVELRERYAYSVWHEPLSASIAAAVAHGLIPALIHRVYQFPFVVRTGGKYKAFGPAVLTRSSTNA